jgi:hypothetical protein
MDEVQKPSINECYIPSPEPYRVHSNYVWRGVHVMKLLIMQLSPICRHFISLRTKYSLLSGLFSNTLRLCSFLNIRDKVSHPYKTTDKVIVLYILIFMFIWTLCIVTEIEILRVSQLQFDADLACTDRCYLDVNDFWSGNKAEVSNEFTCATVKFVRFCGTLSPLTN